MDRLRRERMKAGTMTEVSAWPESSYWRGYRLGVELPRHLRMFSSRG